MSLQLTGKLIEIYPVQQVSEKFRKREFVLETYEDINGKTYTNVAKFQTVQNKCDVLNSFKVGDMVTVSFNVKGNKWERDGKVNYITNLDAWRVERTEGAGNQQGHSQPSTPPLSDTSDLPF